MRFLLDVNVLVALAVPTHSFHEAAHLWFSKEPGRLWATCPHTQAGFLRVVTRVLGGSHDAFRQALAGLEKNCHSRGHEYWTMDTDLRDLSELQRSRIIGANQIADIQLLMLAHRRQGRLASLDAGIRELAFSTPYAESLAML